MKDISEIRADFPILNRKVYDKPLIYFDNGATTQKPFCVLDAVKRIYELQWQCPQRVHAMSDLTPRLMKCQEKVRSFINAGRREIVLLPVQLAQSTVLLFIIGEIYKTGR
jgi:cysteine desulfurase/selenocysteine lyase